MLHRPDPSARDEGFPFSLRPHRGTCPFPVMFLPPTCEDSLAQMSKCCLRAPCLPTYTPNNRSKCSKGRQGCRHLWMCWEERCRQEAKQRTDSIQLFATSPRSPQSTGQDEQKLLL